MTTTTTATDWRPIAGYEGRYSISRDAQVRSERRCVGRRRSEVPEHILRPLTHHPSGLQSVLLQANGKQQRRYIHQLLTETFPELTGTVREPRPQRRRWNRRPDETFPEQSAQG